MHFIYSHLGKAVDFEVGGGFEQYDVIVVLILVGNVLQVVENFLALESGHGAGGVRYLPHYQHHRVCYVIDKQ